MMLSADVVALAAGDCSLLSRAFAAAGFRVHAPAAGIVQIFHDPAALSLLLSVGVHGDETVPIELLAQLLEKLSREPQQLQVNLMIVVGNLDAIRLEKRFVEADLNRLFRPAQGALASTAEAPRAAAIMAATGAFFGATSGPRWHLDLHTAIRPSLYPTFAIIPDAIGVPDKRALADLLGQAGIAAVIRNPTSAGTFSAFSAEQSNAISATVELGQVSRLGENNADAFAAMATTLSAFLRSGHLPAERPDTAPIVFAVAQEIIKHSTAFQLHLEDAVHNFTALPRGSVIATDGEMMYRVEHDEEMVVFPNPNVRPGLRAGLMVVRSRW